MRRMTLEEKIGQMVQIERSVASARVVKEYLIGTKPKGGSVPATNATPQEWIQMVNRFQEGALSTRLEIPMMYGIDAVHGQNGAYGATIFPHNIGLATALEVRATGIPYVFAPCVAVCRNPRWGRCYESYSEDPEIVRAMASEIVPGLQGEIPSYSRKGIPFVRSGRMNVAACAKHYVGDGGTVNGNNGDDTVTDWKNIQEIHMAGYRSSIAKGVSSIMASYSSLNGVKMHANRDMIAGFLKKTLNFTGFVISDWKGIDLITTPIHANYTYSVEKAINAGIDMVMVPFNYTEFITELTQLVGNGFVPMTRIDDAVTRILRVKFVMGMFENPMSDESLVNELGSPEHRELAREAVRKSLVLLKNGKAAEQPLLPLPKKATRILVAGSHANNLGYQCGGWSIEWQGFSGNDLTRGTTILSAIQTAVDPATEVVYHENPDTQYLSSETFSYAIVIVGEHPYAESAGDSTNLTIPEPGPTTIRNVCQSMKCVVLIVSGRPLVIEPYLETMDALVAAWLPGTEGRGIADVLFGEYGFSGKLPRTWFKRVDQLPMNVGDGEDYDPLFPFGFGLSTVPLMAI
ncbi:Beta-glucosidase BoGH3B [Linum grandiflorum]